MIELLNERSEMHNYCVSLDNFLFRRSWGDAVKAMSDVQAGELIKALYRFTEGMGVTPADPIVAKAYQLMTTQLNHSCRRYINSLFPEELNK